MAIASECQTGTVARVMGESVVPTSKHILVTEDMFYGLLYSLVMESSAIDHPSFESWASEYGYDTDSRKAEATYRICLDIALKLRAALGDAGLEDLRTATQDY